MHTVNQSFFRGFQSFFRGFQSFLQRFSEFFSEVFRVSLEVFKDPLRDPLRGSHLVAPLRDTATFGILRDYLTHNIF